MTMDSNEEIHVISSSDSENVESVKNDDECTRSWPSSEPQAKKRRWSIFSDSGDSGSSDGDDSNCSLFDFGVFHVSAKGL